MPTIAQEIEAAVYQKDMTPTWEREDKILRHVNECLLEADECALCLHFFVSNDLSI